MKKLLCLFMVLCILALSGCGADKDGYEVADSVLKEYLDNIDEYDDSVREYGSPASYIHMDSEIVIGILYPETEVAPLNKAINSWIVESVKKYTAEAEEKYDGVNSAELTVAYESYYADETTAGIVLSGTFIAPFLAHPVDIVRTFNVDIAQKRLFGIDELFARQELENFRELGAKKAGVDTDAIDERFLENGYLTEDKIVVVLERGRYLPMSEGTKTVELSYKELEGIISRSFGENKKPEDEVVDSPVVEGSISKKEIDPEKPMVALTFDDGPSLHTDRLLDIFARYGGKGTFFVLGNLIDSRKNTVLRIINEGHEIGNHSWNHRQLTNLSDEEIKDQIMMTRAKIYDVSGVDCRIVRPPYGACNDAVRAVGASVGVSFVNWSVDTLDWKSKNAVAVHNEIMSSVSDGAIILCHDLHKTTVDAMETVVPELIEKGYQLVTVSELMEYSGKSLEVGKMYYKG